MEHWEIQKVKDRLEDDDTIDKRKNRGENNIYYGVVLPLRNSTKNGFEPIFSPIPAVKYNIRSVIFTRPGELKSDFDFGVGITDILFQNFEEINFDYWKSRIINQLSAYVDYIRVNDVQLLVSDTDVDNGTLLLQIDYTIGSIDEDVSEDFLIGDVKTWQIAGWTGNIGVDPFG